MQSEEQITIKRCQYCGKEFIAWKPSLRVCSDVCKQNKAFNLNLQILNALEKIKGKMAEAICKPAPDESETTPAQIESNPATISKAVRSIRIVCNASKAKIKATQNRAR